MLPYLVCVGLHQKQQHYFKGSGWTGVLSFPSSQYIICSSQRLPVSVKDMFCCRAFGERFSKVGGFYLSERYGFEQIKVTGSLLFLESTKKLIGASFVKLLVDEI